MTTRLQTAQVQNGKGVYQVGPHHTVDEGCVGGVKIWLTIIATEKNGEILFRQKA